jgi:hypothetical protein
MGGMMSRGSVDLSGRGRGFFEALSLDDNEGACIGCAPSVADGMGVRGRAIQFWS